MKFKMSPNSFNCWDIPCGQSAAKEIIIKKQKKEVIQMNFEKFNVENINELEEYKISGKPSGYLVSKHGDVFSIKKGLPKKMKPQKQKNGYLLIHLHLNGKSYYRWIHRMVAEVFIPNPNNKPQINHKDGNKENNKVPNLEWVTAKENIQHAYLNKLHPTSKGENSPNAKLSVDDVRDISSMIESNKYTLKEISQKTNISYYSIYLIYMKKEWTEITKDYDFSNFNKFSKNRGFSKLNEKQVHSICKDIKSGDLNGREIAQKYGVFESTVYKIHRGKTWKDIAMQYFDIT